MAILSIELPEEIVDRLSEEATLSGKSADEIVQGCLIERLGDVPTESGASECTKALRALRAAGALSERVARAPIPGKLMLERIASAMTRDGGPSLSEIITAHRGAKE